MSGKTKTELVTMIGQMKQTLSLSMPQFIEVAKGVGIDYDGGNPATLSSQSLKDLHLALERMEPLPF